MAEVLLLIFAQRSCLLLRSLLFWQGWALLISYPNRMLWLKETYTLQSTGNLVVFTISMTWPGMVFEETCLFILVMEYIQPSGILRFHICRFNQPWINTKWNRTSRKFEKENMNLPQAGYVYICVYIYIYLFPVIPIISRNIYCFPSLLSNAVLTLAMESKN